MLLRCSHVQLPLLGPIFAEGKPNAQRLSLDFGWFEQLFTVITNFKHKNKQTKRKET